jgi:hypothetical protein
VTTELVLLLLRFISGSLLIALLLTLFLVIWREYRSTSVQVEARRRSYGQLVVLREIDGRLMMTGENFPLQWLSHMGILSA